MTRRYFLDRFPFFTRPGAKELAFCYIDSGFETYAAFATHLQHYLPLFAELPSFELVYVTTASTRLGQAQTVFERVLSRGRKWLTKVADPDRLLAHFGDRQLFEKRETSSFDRDRLDRLRDDMDTFSGPHFAEMFARWRPPATKLFAPKLPPRRCRTVAACTEKATDLDALERLHNDVDRAPWRERSKKGPFTSVSMEAFTKDSLQSPSTRAIRPGPWRIDPCFGVKGGAGATPVSVGCAATNPFRPRFAPAWVTPAPPPPGSLCSLQCGSHRESTANQKENFAMPSDIRLRLALFLAVVQRHGPKTLESAGAAMVRHFGPRVLRRHRRLLRHRRRRNQLLLYPFAEQNFDWRTADPKRQANALDF